MAKFYQTKTFLVLKTEWEEKLAEAGFNDIEDKKENLTQNSYNAYRQADELTRETRFEYYRIISRRVDEYVNRFPNLTDYLVMKMRGDGLLTKEIALRNNIDRNTVTFIIRRYEHLWGLRAWTLKQRNLKGV